LEKHETHLTHLVQGHPAACRKDESVPSVQHIQTVQEDLVGRVAKLEDTIGEVQDVVLQLNEAPTQGTIGSTVPIVQFHKVQGELAVLSKQVSQLTGAQHKDAVSKEMQATKFESWCHRSVAAHEKRIGGLADMSGYEDSTRLLLEVQRRVEILESKPDSPQRVDPATAQPQPTAPQNELEQEEGEVTPADDSDVIVIEDAGAILARQVALAQPDSHTPSADKQGKGKQKAGEQPPPQATATPSKLAEWTEVKSRQTAGKQRPNLETCIYLFSPSK
jgi:hypothetical protein